MTDWHTLTTAERDTIMRQYIAEGEAAWVSGNTDINRIADCPYRWDKQEARWWLRGWGNARLGAMLGSKSSNP